MKLLNNKIYPLTLLVLSLITSCDDPFELNAEQAPTRLVIEGLITDDDTTHYVRVTQTKEFGTPGATPIVATAEVSVSDSDGIRYDFVHNNTGDSNLDGYYFSTSSFAGKVGNTYTLSVTHDGVTYTASDELLRVTEIDSLAVRADEDLRDRDPDQDIPGIDFDEFYEILFYAKEPQETDDYYLFKYYKNGEIVKDFESDIYFAEDTFVGEDIFDIETAGYFAEDDTVTVEFYSLTRDAYVYYTDLFNVLNNDGGMFGAVPSNPRTNITGEALGYFQTSSVRRKSKVVKDPG